MAKDCWDKAEIIGKTAGAVLIPILVAGTVLAYNSQANQRATGAQMIEIAIGVLSREPSKGAPDPLRAWAISVLQNPKDIIALDAQAAAQLKITPLPSPLVSGLKMIPLCEYSDGSPVNEPCFPWLNQSEKVLGDP